MSKLITEHLESKIRERIPSMARDIHEGILGAIGSAVSAVAGAGKEFIKREASRAAQSNLDRQTRLRDTLVGTQVANKLGMSHKEYLRLKNDVSRVPPTHPQRMIPDPNHRGPGNPPLIANPQFPHEFAKYQNDLEDHRAALQLDAHEAGILGQNRSLGQVANRTDKLINIYKNRI